MFVRVFIALIFLLKPALAGELTGFAAIDTRYFFEEPKFAAQDDNNGPSFILEPEYYHVSADDKNIFTFKPFVRYDPYDSHRSLIDVRQLDWLYIGDDYEVRLGNSEVFWGVTESNHLVDIVNQTDTLSDLDNEDKMGQPMLQYALFKDYGDLRFFYLPYFVERRFPAQEGRLRSELLVEEKLARYDSSSEEWSPSAAFRYSNVIADFDLGLSYFAGVSREPTFATTEDSAGATILTPIYDNITQAGLDLQYTGESFLWKLEAINRSGQGRRFYAATFGTEYTLYAIMAEYDLGLLLEYSKDDRSDNAPITSFDNDIFLGARLTFNDIADSEILAGISIDHHDESKSGVFEAATRIGDRYKIEFDLRFFADSKRGNFQENFAKDSYAQLRLARYF